MSRKVSLSLPLQTESHKINSAIVFQRKRQNLQAYLFLVSNIDPRKQTTSVGPILTPNTNAVPSSAPILSQKKAKWELFQVQLSTSNGRGSLGNVPGIIRSNLGK